MTKMKTLKTGSTNLTKNIEAPPTAPLGQENVPGTR